MNDEDKIQVARRDALSDAVMRHPGGINGLGMAMGYANGEFLKQMLRGRRRVTEKTVAKIEAIPGYEGWFALRSAPATLMAFPSARVTAKEAISLEANPEFPAIPKVRFKLSAGATGFAVEYIEDGGDPIVFRRQWFEHRGYKPEKLFAVIVMNGSMEPTLFAGDLVVVNTEDTSLKDGAVVAANFEGEPVVKRLQRDEGQWWLASDNPDKTRYPRKLCTAEVKIIGRVVHKQSETI